MLVRCGMIHYDVYPPDFNLGKTHVNRDRSIKNSIETRSQQFYKPLRAKGD